MAKLVSYLDSLRDGKMCKVKKGQCTVTGEWFEAPMVIGDWVKWISGTVIQEAAPYLTSEQREFWITHLTPAEWNQMLDGEEEDSTLTMMFGNRD